MGQWDLRSVTHLSLSDVDFHLVREIGQMIADEGLKIFSEVYLTGRAGAW